MREETLNVSVGARLWYQGSAWTVVEHDGMSVLLRSGEQLKRVDAPSLVGLAGGLDEPVATEDPLVELDSVVLASLSVAQRREIESEATTIHELILEPSDIPASERYQRAAKVLGTTARTVRRRTNRYLDHGIAGLVDPRLLQATRRSIPALWDEACREVLESFTSRSNPTIGTVRHRANALFVERCPGGAVPSQASAYRRIKELDKGRYTFGAAKQRRSVAERPAGVLGRLRADRPGQYVVLDTTRLDVFAMEPVTGRWVNTELTVAMDLYSRCVLGLVLRAVSTKSQDVAGVLYQVITPQHWGPPAQDAMPGPYAGVPENLVAMATGALPDTIVVDHGKVYLAEHTKAVCHRLGINVQPAISHKPTDKPTIERFFRTLRQQLLEHLPAYKGPDVYSRGKDVEAEAFYYVAELEAIIRDWVGIYHHSPHQGLCDPLLPHVDLSPAEMFARGMAASGVLRLPASEDLRMEFLDVAWRTIQHYGVEIDGRRYDGPGLNLYRGTKSPHGGAHPGKWPIMVDHDDVRTVYFRDPATGAWHDLVWEHAGGLDAPFSAEAAAYTRRLSRETDRHVDPGTALADLLERYSQNTLTDRREKNLARRLATKPTTDADPAAASRAEMASTPGVIDLLTHLERRRNQPPVTDDLDVFERYDNDDDRFEVFDE